MTDRSGVFLNSALGATLGSGGAGGLTPTTITGNTTALAGLEYRCNSASQLLVTMPASPADGNKVGVVGIPISGTGGWKLAPNTSQTLWYGQQSTTAGFVGTAASSGVWEYISSASAWRYLYGTSDFTVGAVPGDPFFTNVTLLVPGSGSIQDFSGNARALTNTNVTFSASHTKYAAQNMSFNGSSAKLTDSVQTGYKFPGDFCIEGWVYFNAVNVKQVIFQCGSSTTSATGFYLYLNSTGHLVFNSNSADQITDAGALSAGTFYHIAVSRQGGLVQLFRGTATGASVGTPWASTANFSDGYCFIGADSGSANYLNAFVEGFRVTNGYSRYSANFTVPAVPFYTAADTTADALWQNQVLCCSFDSNFNDSSGNAITLTNTGSVVISNSVFKVGSGSAQFNGGSNSYLSNNTAGNLLPFILGDFSVKFWVFPTIFGSLNGSHLISMGGVANECGLYLSGAIPTVIWNGSLLTSSGGGIPLNTWTEVEFVHVGTTLTLYINGQNVGQATVSASTAVTNISIGANYSQANSGLIGYIDNLEITGFGSPTANFTPWASPFLTAMPSGYDPFWQQTTFLLRGAGSNAVSDVSGNALAMTPTTITTGTSAPTPAQDAYWTNFNGSSSKIAVTVANAAATLTGDFTFEARVYLAAISGIQCMMDLGGATAAGVSFAVNASGYLTVTVNGAIVATSTGTAITATTNTDVAIVRKGFVILFFVGGVFQNAVTSISTSFTTNTMQIGTYNAGSNWFGGKTEGMRLTRAARYTANFTPPASPFLLTGPV